jgi:2,6-dihydroxypyridine 3-monooxygenase
MTLRSASMPTVAVVGGSLGGLTAALVLADVGCDVVVLERSAAELEARGAGIAVLDDTVRWFVEHTTIDSDVLCSKTGYIRFLAPDGSIVHERAHRYRFSSWNTIYRALLAQLPPERYRLNCEVVGFSQDADSVEITLRTGQRLRRDVLVCADGVGSPSRAALLPHVTPRYAGYVAWRGTVPEADLEPTTRAALTDAITYQVLPRSHVLAYPIPCGAGPGRPGTGLMNVVWYRNVAAGAKLDALMTDRDGRVRPVSLPPGTVRPERIAELRRDASMLLAPAIDDVVQRIAEPFVQAVFDVEVDRMAVGRVCLIGDAAFAVRPHAGASTAKAAADAWELGAQLSANGYHVTTALAQWEQRQLALGKALLERSRRIGDASQKHGAFVPGNPGLILGLRAPGR